MRLNLKNRTIFCKDNLDILRGINSNCVDLIYLDPPFNKKKEFTAPMGSSADGASFRDWFKEEDVKDEWIETIKEDYDGIYQFLTSVRNLSSFQSHKNKHYLYNYCYLCYMAIRLIEMHRILKNTGSIYLHCDPTMSHYLKILMDLIFGEKNFRNEIVWKRTGKHSDNKTFGNESDLILFYFKSERSFFDKKNAKIKPSKKEILKKFRFKDNKGSYRIDRLDARKLSGGGYSYNYNGVKDIWRRPLERMKELEKKDLIHWTFKNAKKSRPYKKVYQPQDTEKVSLQNIWTDINITNIENKDYPTQKPRALLERIIQASSNEEDVVLDPFCGCATTCVAAEKLGRQWIGIDISHMAYDLVRQRLKDEVKKDLFDPDKETKYTTVPPKRTDLGVDYREKKYVYIISHPKQLGYKVGIAKDYKSRLNSYQTGDRDRNYKLEYYFLTPYYRETEKYIHKKFNADGEWVEGDLENIKRAIENYK